MKTFEKILQKHMKNVNEILLKIWVNYRRTNLLKVSKTFWKLETNNANYWKSESY